MILKIDSVAEAGNLENERVIIKAHSNGDIGKFFLARTRITSDRLTNQISDIFWIPDRQIKKDDLIAIYTKSGSDHSKENTDGSTTHFFYWGKSSPLWNSSEFGPLLIQSLSWSLKRGK